ncbi:transporter substrate-binding domain-containing protein [Pantoea sp. B9002]|uniref:ATP-binding protein n=1 Tax=Pantoea sp. B9002 TaxID=2726979 RepID=UPI0015A3773B|nr:transporter substrate-binding domain-containing protein [Pantoea sp. B9002]NWA63442.1 transporter substrate-binding domain-containing protein [Pantoea sp. B9002]
MLLHRLTRLIMFIAMICLTALAHAAGQPVHLAERVSAVVAPIVLPASGAAWLKTHTSLNVGVWLPAQPPFMMDYAPQKEFEGLSADYLALLGKMLDVSVKVYVYNDRRSAITALEQGEVELLSGPALHGEHDSNLIYSIPFIQDSAVLIHQKGVQPSSPETLRGKQLLYVGDDEVALALSNAWPDAVLSRQTSYYRAIAIVKDNPDALLWGSRRTLESINHQIYRSALVTTPASVGASLSQGYLTRPENQPLIDTINAALEKIPTETLNKLDQVWRQFTNGEPQTGILNLSESEKAWLRDNPVIPVYLDNNNSPLSMVDSEGHAHGIVINLLNTIANQSGVKFRYERMNNLVDMRQKLIKENDGVIATADASARHEPDIRYTTPYFISRWVLVTRDNAPTITSLADMGGKNIVVYPGVYYLAELKAAYPQVHFTESTMSFSGFFKILTGKTDGAIVPVLVADVLNDTLVDRFFKVALVMDLPPVRMAMAVNTANSQLLSILNKAIEQVPPRNMVREYVQWQKHHPLSSLSLWDRYKYYLYAALLLITVIVAFILLRNAMLKKNVAALESLQAELEAARKAAEQASLSKGTFLAQMSHEIRTPMNALIGLLELENFGHSTPEQRRNNLAVAYESSKSLLMLVGDILDMAKIESGSYTVRHVPVSLSETLNSVTTLFRYSAEEKHLQLSSTLEVTHPDILFDPIMLKQILSNLLSNAIKFTEQGEIEVGLYQSGEVNENRAVYVIEVSDSGSGLSETQQREIFEPFVQVEDSRARHQGTGLGLSICRHLADLLGGRLSIDSEPGEGSTFIFRFSAEVNHNTAAVASSRAGIPRTAHTLKRILIVDDHAPNRLLLSQQIAFAGHHSVAVESGAQALLAWADTQTPFDVVITDCNMPEMSGFELTKKLRHIEQNAGRVPIPIFGLTAMAEQDVAIRARASGMTDCLFKPIEIANLLARIDGDVDAPSPIQSESPTIMTLDKLARSNPRAFDDLVLTIIEQNQKDIEQLALHIAAVNFPAIAITAHNILGGARLIDASDLEEVSKKIESAAKESNLNSVSEAYQQCVGVILQLEHQLQAALNASN